MDTTSMLDRAAAHLTAAELVATATAARTGEFGWRAAAVGIAIAGAGLPAGGVSVEEPGGLSCGQQLAAAAAVLDALAPADRPAGLLLARAQLADAIRDVHGLEDGQ